jgi:hypothetical protein
MRFLIVIALSFLLTSGSLAHDPADKARCAVVKEKIRKIHSRMRSGYTRAQGEHMEAQLRKLRQQRKSKCGSA